MLRISTLVLIVLVCKSNALQEKRNTLFSSNPGKLKSAVSLSLLEDLEESATETEGLQCISVDQYGRTTDGWCKDNCLNSWDGKFNSHPACTTTSRRVKRKDPHLYCCCGLMCPVWAGKVSPVNCAGTWSAYGTCSKTCGGGQHVRTYKITQNAAHGGSGCPASNGQTQSRSCSAQDCPVAAPTAETATAPEAAKAPAEASTDTSAGVTEDPHFVGFDGSRYDFQGVSGEVFNLITDTKFQFNARFIANPDHLDQTYLGVLGFMIGSHKLVVTPEFVLLDDGALHEGQFTLAEKEGPHEVGLVRVSKNAVVILCDAFTVSVSILHKGPFAYLNIDCTAHSDHLTNPHGLLGQTARYLVTGDAPSPVVLPHSNKDAAGFIEGKAEDYVVSDGPLGTSFTFNRFGTSQQKKSGTPRRFSYAQVHKAEVNL